ncbi:MAG TPA: Ohr family peroxiredoxin [Alphaproteobacteria bacterium]|nr:Ohr family peroxiredoxin [Alphaproteobacteria bacterium]
MPSLDKVIYTGRTRTSAGGRNGTARSDDGRLDIALSTPGTPGGGTNPEQLFAAGWSACFIGAMQKAARSLNVTLPADLAVDAEVDLGLTGEAYGLAARLTISAPGLERAAAQAVADAAHRLCPYSLATRGNIEVAIAVA